MSERGDRTPPAANDRYELAQAAADLAAAGLLREVLVAARGSWRRATPATLNGWFHGAALDSRHIGPGQLFVGLPGPRVDGRRFAAQALAAGAHALVGPGPVDDLAESDGAHALGGAPDSGVVLVCPDALAGLAHLAARWRERMPAHVIGLTGSNGKTTTKDLLAAILGAAGGVLATAGNLNSAQGVPLTLLGLLPRHRFAVIEMGATAPGHIAARCALARPSLGIITNAAAAHLAEFTSLERIIAGKGELVAALPAAGTAVLNADSPGYAQWRRMASCRIASWGREAGDHRWDWSPAAAGAGGVLHLDSQEWPVPLPGRHNGANLCAAILAARAAGLDDAQIRAGLRDFQPSPHRAALRRLGGRLVVDDCYNANPEGMRSAGRMLCDLTGGAAWAVLGGMAELGDASHELHLAVGRDLAQLDIASLVAVGESAAPLADGFAAAGKPAHVCRDPREAAELLDARTRPGDRILVKGSRSTAMERVIDALIDACGWTEAKP